ncbi:MAG TPA: ATP-binding cassette domain-containing protein [Acidimicrobiales bacterium]|nr:ATP-binding cassette domain-containing protein [Acidimicrobiales bacterium]
MSTPILEATGLTKRFGGVLAVDAVDFRVLPNEVVGIIGPNGSGKTTLFNLLSGFLRPASGTIRWEGRDVTKAAPHNRARAGLVRTFQESMVFPGLTVRENLAMAIRAAELAGRQGQAADDLAEYVRITHVLDSIAQDLSWGQTRLLGIALALAMNPSVLLLDEPFAGLSPVAAEDVSAIIRRLRVDGFSLCVIDHEMSFLLPICDRLVVLVNGATLADGDPQEIIDRHEVRAAYLGL